jgi:chitinase
MLYFEQLVILNGQKMKFGALTQLIMIAIVSLATGNSLFARPNHIVLGYVPARRDAISSPDDFNYEAFTHLARAFIREQDDGSLVVPADYFSESFDKAARSHGVKLLMSIGGGSSEADHWPAIARDPQHVQIFLANIGKLLADHHYDGIDIDWEPPPMTDADGTAYADFLKSIRRRFPKIILTLAMSPTKKATAHIPMDDVVASVDFINAMSYSYATPSSGLASFNGNLHPDPQAAHTRHSIDEDMANLIDAHHVPPSKLLLGINFWAGRYRVDQLGDKFTPHTKGLADNIDYPTVIDLLGTGRYNALRDPVADSPYLVSKKGGCVITYDDPTSMRDKCQAAIQLNCAGVIIWNVGADTGGGESPLLNAIDESFGMVRLPISKSALEREIVRLGKRPVPPDSSIESLLKIDSRLRADRGASEDQKWIATAPAVKAANP